MVNIYQDNTNNLTEITNKQLKKLFNNNKLNIKDRFDKTYINLGKYYKIIEKTLTKPKNIF